VCLQRLHPNAKIVTPLITNFNRRADDLHQLPQPARPAATLSTPRKPISKWPSNRLPAYVLPLKALDSSEGGLMIGRRCSAARSFSISPLPWVRS
jgi:hypothetical protein